MHLSQLYALFLKILHTTGQFLSQFLEVNFGFKTWNVEWIWSSDILLLSCHDGNEFSVQRGSAAFLCYTSSRLVILFCWQTLPKIALH